MKGLGIKSRGGIFMYFLRMGEELLGIGVPAFFLVLLWFLPVVVVEIVNCHGGGGSVL